MNRAIKTRTPRTAPLSDVLVAGRALVLAFVILLTGAVSHVWADGRLPSVFGLAGLLMMTAVAATFWLQRPAGRLRLLVMVVGGQSVTHLALTLMAGHAGDAAVSAPRVVTPVAGQTLRDAYQAQQDSIGATVAGGPNPFLHLVEHALEAGPLMMATHTGAAAAVALWLAAGEQALVTLLALTADNVAAAVRRLDAVLLGLAVQAVAAHRPPETGSTPLRLLAAPIPLPALTSHAVSRRGPPFLLGN